MSAALTSALVLAAACSGASVRETRPSCLDRAPSCEDEAAAIRDSLRPYRDRVELERDATSALHVTGSNNPAALRNMYRALTEVLHAVETVMAEVLVCSERTDEAARELERLLRAPPWHGGVPPPRSDLHPILERAASFAEECTPTR